MMSTINKHMGVRYGSIHVTCITDSECVVDDGMRKRVMPKSEVANMLANLMLADSYDYSELLTMPRQKLEELKKKFYKKALQKLKNESLLEV